VIASLRGTVLSKAEDRAVVEAAGVGYEVFVTSTTSAQLAIGHEGFLHIEESFGMYGGGATLYGFAAPSERAMFRELRDNVPSTGAKKALEYLEKASKSLPDFRRAILDKDVKLLTGVFGFTKKTAERLVESLKDKLEAVHVAGAERLVRADSADLGSAALSQALSALAALGYKPNEAKLVLQSVAQEAGGKELAVEQIVRLALKRL